MGVSSSGNGTYDPHVAQGGAGSSTGLYQLQLSQTHAPSQPDLVGASFQVVESSAAWGDPITVHYTIENRGGADAGTFTAELRVSADNRIDASDPLLATLPVAGLAAGAAVTGTVTVGLPGTPPASFPAPEQVFLGLQLDSGTTGAAASPTTTSSPQRGNDWDSLPILTSQSESEPNDTTAAATRLVPNSRTTGTLTTTDVDFFRLTLTEPGRLTARVHAEGFPTRLSLYDSLGRPLIQSDGQSPSQGDDLIVQHLAGEAGGTTYFLKVEGLSGGTGTYALTTEFLPATLPFEPLPVGLFPASIVTGDFNGDGRLDLAAANLGSNDVSVLLGNGDGTFQKAMSFKVGSAPDRPRGGGLQRRRPPRPGRRQCRLQGRLGAPGQRGWDVPGPAAGCGGGLS